MDVFRAIGIERFDFIGGEVTRYGDGWLDLAQHCRQQGAKTVTIYTNGWWLEQTNFTAAGKTYPDVPTYLADLREHGVTHILFSLDGPEDMHDHSRGHPGLYQRVLAGIPAGESCRVAAPGLAADAQGFEHGYLCPASGYPVAAHLRFSRLCQSDGPGQSSC